MNKKWISYWKKNLSDSMRTDIDIDNSPYFVMDTFNIRDTKISLLDKVNKLIDIEETKVNAQHNITNRDNEKWISIDEIQILICPLIIRPIPEHAALIKYQQIHYPFWYYALINREGELSIPFEKFPVLQRKYLKPIADDRIDFFFGSVDDVDKAIALRKQSFDSYTEYVDSILDVFKEISGQNLETFQIEGYHSLYNSIILLPKDEINAAFGILELYEKILQENNLSELITKVTSINNPIESAPVQVSDLIYRNQKHLGQMGYDFPLSISQRKALYTLLDEDNTIFAVNGPPGTGKTTLLQSVVANELVNSILLDGGNTPPVILACSANNQAVTNIIESFSKSKTKPGELEGRWIPDFDGYATYLSANGKTEKELKGINYKKIGGDGIFSILETPDYIERAKVFFLEKAASYLGKSVDIKGCTELIKAEIKQLANVLRTASIYWTEYLNAENIFRKEYLVQPSKQKEYYINNLLDEEYLSADILTLEKLEQDIILYFRSEPFFRKLLCFFNIRYAWNNRMTEVRILLRNSLIEFGDDPKQYIQNNILDKINIKIKTAQLIISQIIQWKNWKKENQVIGNPPRDEAEYWDYEQQKIDTKQQTGENAEMNCFYDELDITIRHKAFQLAIHYWEGKWILETEKALLADNFNKRGFEVVKDRWRRHAMLTPCFVSTFYMAPKFFNYSKYLGVDDNNKPIWEYPALFDFVGILIVDEAGQVPPEIGVATFSLAKKAIVVGDVKQIEPVWSITNKVDIGNLKKSELITSYDDLSFDEVFDSKGFLSSTGSIMKIAQNSCNYKEEGIAEKGVMLVEHRRCYDEIINYCNELAYNGFLKPLKGKAKSENLFAPMLCIHVDGNSTVQNKDRYNESEVESIINWLAKNKNSIEQEYINGKHYNCIEDIVGIITPFVGQKNLLRRKLKSAGFKVDSMKLGTVHALQGAERPIIIFSMVYGKDDASTMFFDRNNKPNMLNVAVSRAKDSFIVFANTGILDKKANTPSGILARFLKYED